MHLKMEKKGRVTLRCNFAEANERALKFHRVLAQR